jgi:hypothetical protein
MMNLNLKVGDLVYVPSKTYVHQPLGDTQKYEVLEEPQALLVIGENSRFYEVLMMGSSWYVSKQDVYGTARGQHNGC